MFTRLQRTALALGLIWVFATPTRGEPLTSFTEPYRQVDVSLGEPGVISYMKVEPGAVVDKGELLVALDTSVLEAALCLAKFRASETSAVEAARAELNVRSEALRRLEGLKEKGYATQSAFQRAYADVQIASARLKLAERDILAEKLECKRIEAQIGTRQAYSPISGVVSEVHREVGEAVLINDPKVVTLVQLHKLRVRFPVRPRSASKLKLQQPVFVTLPDQRTQQVRGQIDRIAPIIDAKSGTVEVTVVVDNARRHLRSGTRCLLHLDESEPQHNDAIVSERRPLTQFH